MGQCADESDKGCPGDPDAKPAQTWEDGVNWTCPKCGRRFATESGRANHSCLGGPAQWPARTNGGNSPSALAAVRLVYNNNPFYLISAGLVLYSLHIAFPAGDPAAYSWTLLGVLAGYTALVVATAIAVVRLGRVWDDARTVILTVVNQLATAARMPAMRVPTVAEIRRHNREARQKGSPRSR